jgi:hypothetical protein
LNIGEPRRSYAPMIVTTLYNVYTSCSAVRTQQCGVKKNIYILIIYIHYINIHVSASLRRHHADIVVVVVVVVVYRICQRRTLYRGETTTGDRESKSCKGSGAGPDQGS